MTTLIGVIRPTTTETYITEGESYEEARLLAEAQVPEGWEIISTRAYKGE